MGNEELNGAAVEVATTGFGLVAETSLELEQIIAAHIATNPQRREWRYDILVSTLVEVLVGGDRTAEELQERVNKVLRTRTVTGPEFGRALEDAAAAGLVARLTDLAGVEKWQVTKEARDAAEEDRAWATRIYEKFERDVAAELGAAGVEQRRGRPEKAARHLLAALSAGAAGYGVTDELDGLLRPISFAEKAVLRALGDIEPTSMREALTGLAYDAMDGEEDFANELVHLLVVSNLLHGLATRRDIPNGAQLDGTRLAIDTSALVPLVSTGEPEEQLLVEMIELSRRAGVEIVVAEHTLSEWDRLWESAERQAPAAHDGDAIIPGTFRLADNPFISAFLRRKDDEPGLTWGRFVALRKDIRPRLRELEVNIRPAGNHRDEDRAVVACVYELLRKYSQDPGIRGNRNRAGAEADAETCAMLHRWRTSRLEGRCSAYFIAADRLTERAYKEIFPEDNDALVVNTAGWAAYVGALVTDHPKERADLALLVSSAVQRNSIFAVATSYTLEEAIELSRMLADGGAVAPSDARSALQLNFDDLLADTSGRSPDKVRSAALQLQAARAQRQNARAVRERQRGEQAQQGAAAAVAAANEDAAEARREAEGLAAELEKAKAQLSQPRFPPAPAPAPAAALSSLRADDVTTLVSAVAVTLVLAVLAVLSAVGVERADAHTTSETSNFSPWALARAGAGAAGILFTVLTGAAAWFGIVGRRHDFVRILLGAPLAWGAALAASGALVFVFALG